MRAVIADPEGAAIRVRWVLRRESGEYATGGDFRPVPPEVEGAVLEGRANGARLRMPKDPGPYRLFLYAYDAAGRAATANVPLLVKGEVRTPMPFYVYRDGFEGMPWAPSGWMGAIESLTLDGDHAGNPHEGKACIEMRFVGEVGTWVGVAWQHPANNWGDQEGGYDLTGAKYLELWARGRLQHREDQHRGRSPRRGQGAPRFGQNHGRGHRSDVRVAALPHSPEEARPLEHQDRLRRGP